MLFRVQEVKSSWEVSIAGAKADVARATKNLQTAYRNANLKQIIEWTDQLEGLTRGLEIAVEAFAKLFPVETV